jgi:hypothetical protein
MLQVMGSTLTQLVHIAGNTVIQFTETDPALLNVDAVVEEQDTNLILGKSPVILDTIESFPSMVNKMEQQTCEKVGNVLVKQSVPIRFIAIVYDVEHTPIGEKIWIEEAILNILAHCDKYRIKTLAMPLLGTSYGKLEEESIIQMLQNSLIQNRRQTLKKILIYKI